MKLIIALILLGLIPAFSCISFSREEQLEELEENPVNPLAVN